MAIETYYYGQGRISIALRNPDGGYGTWRWIGDVSALSVKLDVEKVEHKESYSGQRGLVRSFPIGKTCTLELTLHQVDPDNLALVFYGSVVNLAAGKVTAETLPAGLATGVDTYLAQLGVQPDATTPAKSSLVITDSTATPKTLVAGTDYVLEPNFGRVSWLNVTGYTQPFKAAYSYAARKTVGLFTSGQPSIGLRYEGVNLAEGNAPVLAEFFKVAPNPLQELALVTSGNDVAGMQITAGVLIDTARPVNSPLGPFGAITQLAAA